MRLENIKPDKDTNADSLCSLWMYFGRVHNKTIFWGGFKGFQIKFQTLILILLHSCLLPISYYDWKLSCYVLLDVRK